MEHIESIVMLMYAVGYPRICFINTVDGGTGYVYDVLSDDEINFILDSNYIEKYDLSNGGFLIVYKHNKEDLYEI